MKTVGSRKSRKTLVAFAVMGALTAIISIPVAASYAAGNISDQRFIVNTPPACDETFTPARAKWDYTSCYVFNDGSSCSVDAQAFSCYSDGSIAWGSPKLPSKRVAVGCMAYVDNLVREGGYYNCRLLIAPRPCNISQRIRLLWSPDSI
jgi:hypothetical protein